MVSIFHQNDDAMMSYPCHENESENEEKQLFNFFHTKTKKKPKRKEKKLEKNGRKNLRIRRKLDDTIHSASIN